MKAWILQVNPETGDVLLTYRRNDMHICIEHDAEEFAAFASMVNGALGDSKMAAS